MAWNLVSAASAWAEDASASSPWVPSFDPIDADEGQFVFVALLGNNNASAGPTFTLDKPSGETNDWVNLERIIGGSTSNTSTPGNILGIKVAKPGGWSNFSPTATITNQQAPPGPLLGNWSVWEGGSLLPRWIVGHGLLFPPQWIPANNANPTESQMTATLSSYYQPRGPRSGPPLTIGEDLAIGMASVRDNFVPTQDSDTINGSWTDIGDSAGGLTNSVGEDIGARQAAKLVTATGDQTLDMTGASKSVLLALCAAESVSVVQQRVAITGTLEPRLTLDTASLTVDVGDIIFAAAAQKAAGTQTISDPSGYTADHNKVSGVDPVQSTRMETFHKIADGTEPNTTDLTLGVGSTPGIGGIIRCRAASPTIGIDIQSSIMAGAISSPLTADHALDWRPGDILLWMSSSFRTLNLPTITITGITGRHYGLTGLGTSAGTDIRMEAGFFEIDTGSGSVAPQFTITSGSGSTQATVGIWRIRALFPPQSPTALACLTPTSTSVGFEWTPPTGPSVDEYEVRINGGAETSVGTDTDHTFTGLTPLTTYTLEVRACNEDGCSDWATIECSTLPAPVTPVADPITITGATICWPSAGGGVTYEITLDGSPLPDTTELCVEVTGLNPGTTHTFCVAPCTVNGCGEATCIEFTTLAPQVAWSVCPCGPGWRVEVCNLRTGVIRGVLMPTGMDFQPVLNAQGTGTLTLPIRTVRALDVWPDFTSVYITREGMDPANDDCLFAGIVRKATGSNGTVSIGLDSIESYLWRRRLKRDLSFTNIGQNQIMAALVAETVTDGIPLTGVAETPGTLRNRDYLAADRAYIGPLLEQFTNSENGPSWRLEHAKTAGSWSTRIVFADTVGDDRDTVLRGDYDGNDYGLDLDSQDHASWVDGFNQAQPPLTSTASDLSIYPIFDADPTFDTPLQESLDQQTQGALTIRGDIAAVPSFTLLGETIKASQMRVGDSAIFHLNQGFIAFHGRARVYGITYRIGEGQPLTRELALVPTDSAIASVMNATDTSQCDDCR